MYDGVQPLQEYKNKDDLNIFVDNQYKKYEIPTLSHENLKNIVSTNAVPKFEEKLDSNEIIMKLPLFGMKSLFNHSRNTNCKIEYICDNYIFIFANEDIEEGSELVLDYFSDIQDSSNR